MSRTRAVRLTEPDVRDQVSVAIHAVTPGSVAARGFVAAARGLSLDELLDQRPPADPPLR